MADSETIERTEHYVRPDVRAFLDMMNAIDAPPMSAVGPEAARAGYIAMGQMAEADPRPLAVIRDLTCPGPAGDIRLRFYDTREVREAGPVVVFYHGGGFVIGDLESHHSLCTAISADLDLPVVAVDYRLAPEAPFPAAPDDCEAATRWIASSPAELGRTFTGLVPMGDSAGGNLTIVIAQALAAKPAAVPVLVQVPLYPVADDNLDDWSYHAFAEGFLLTRETMIWFGEAYGAEQGHPRSAPIKGDLAGTPPTVLVTAGLDPLRDGGRAYGAALIQAGVDVTYLEMKGTIHGFVQTRKALPSANDDLAAILAEVRVKLAKAGA
ncbi:alpha/beta hydrolase [Novosphingobium sp. KCTC 2891]|uniref:alpha/beta hydrolase n=1 Tax=Novosphingobium sp. KCTC 2891 TaxID=2989730 RepID=UPI0022217A4F|nr:alpha/beta hydrolase [Novosphingobium sp. KCTC 2891]MCW1384174.1 alpha/beta hydrolase [Novosphingobium sp. KCTC 2891]